MSFPGTRLEQSETVNFIRAASHSRAVFFTASALLYIAAVVLATLTLNPYFSQTWDVSTFVQAAHRFLDGRTPFDLYAQSRAAQTWPYAYPPLHAFVVAIALFIGNAVRTPLGLPDYVWARVPAMLADIGIAVALYSIALKKSEDEWIARAATLLWLFNPVTFYNTAVQGHFESEWLLFVLLAYVGFENSRGIILPTIALAVAVLFKQVAILFVIPVWMFILKAEGGRMKDEKNKLSVLIHPSPFILHPLARAAISLLIFTITVGAVCLPFLLYSDDFLYMNFTYVENVPVQTQSWIVALLGLVRASPTALTTDFFLLRYQTIVTLFVVLAIAFVAARRGWSLYLAATLIAIAFSLTSRKVMGYYYVMLFPFLFVEVLSRRRFDLALIAIVATTWIALSPYYASWVNHDHWWVYAGLGVLNSAFFVWLFWQMTNDQRPTTAEFSAVGSLRSAVMISSGLFASALFAALLQPFLSNNGSPIRAPIVAAGLEFNALVVFGVMMMFVAGALGIVTRFAVGALAPSERAPVRPTIAAWGIVLIFAPLFFSIYTLTKETTAIFEIALKALGV